MITKDEAKKTIIQLMKYGVIGVLNTLITAISFYLLNTWLGVPYGAANIIGYVLGVTVIPISTTSLTISQFAIVCHTTI